MATWTSVLHATRHGVMAYAVVECAAGSVAGITECQMDLCDLARAGGERLGGGSDRCRLSEWCPALFKLPHGSPVAHPRRRRLGVSSEWLHTSESPYTVVRDVIPQNLATPRIAKSAEHNDSQNTLRQIDSAKRKIPKRKFPTAKFQLKIPEHKIQDAAFEMLPGRRVGRRRRIHTCDPECAVSRRRDCAELDLPSAALVVPSWIGLRVAPVAPSRHTHSSLRI